MIGINKHKLTITSNMSLKNTNLNKLKTRKKYNLKE